MIVNGHPEVQGKDWAEPAAKRAPTTRRTAFRFRQPALPPGTRDRFQELGPAKFATWVREQKRLLVTDTTFRDAHQSLLATRMRTADMLAHRGPLRGRARRLVLAGDVGRGDVRHVDALPQGVALGPARASCASASRTSSSRCCCGPPTPSATRTIPTTSCTAFVKESAEAGIDLFRIFDALNWLPNLQARPSTPCCKTGALCEAAICYTGDILDPKRDKYTLKYYVNLAKELEKLGTHLLAIKDMAGLCKPYAAQQLVKALRQEVGIPIHFHTHDSAGGQIASLPAGRRGGRRHRRLRVRPAGRA